MKFKKESIPHIAIFVLCSALFFLFSFSSSASSEQLYRGLILCSKTLIPTLFPYMVISEMLVRSGTASFISPAVEKITKKLFGISGAGGVAIILGILCGFPVGAKITAELYQNGTITKREAERLMGICNLPSPPFVIFAVGEKLFGSRQIGLLLYFNILAVTLILGMIGKKSVTVGKGVEYRKSEPIFTLFTESISSASGAVIKVCAYVTFFSALIGGLSPIFQKVSPIIKAVVFSFFELTSGVSACSALAEREKGLIVASAAAGWSGLSVFCQIFSISRTKDESVSMRFYLSSKIISSAVCGSITAMLIKTFPTIIPSKITADSTVSLISLYPSAFVIAANIIFIISLFIYFFKNLDRRHII